MSTVTWSKTDRPGQRIWGSHHWQKPTGGENQDDEKEAGNGCSTQKSMCSLPNLLIVLNSDIVFCTLRIHPCTIWFLVFRSWKERDRDASRFMIPMSAALWRYLVVVQWRQPSPLIWDPTTTTSDEWCWPFTGPTVWGRGEFPWLLIALMDWKVSIK